MFNVFNIINSSELFHMRITTIQFQQWSGGHIWW